MERTGFSIVPLIKQSFNKFPWHARNAIELEGRSTDDTSYLLSGSSISVMLLNFYLYLELDL